jgi:hypothetical protein
MKYQVNKQPDIKPFIKQKTSLKEHPETLCTEWNRIRIAAYSFFSSYNSNITIQTTDFFCRFQNTLIEADAVSNRKYYPDFF